MTALVAAATIVFMSEMARRAAEDEVKEEPCPICFESLPDTGRGIVPCVSTRHRRE